MMICNVTFVVEGQVVESRACMESLKKNVTVTCLKIQVPTGADELQNTSEREITWISVCTISK
jgi:hypothetical protein